MVGVFASAAAANDRALAYFVKEADGTDCAHPWEGTPPPCGQPNDDDGVEWDLDAAGCWSMTWSADEYHHLDLRTERHVLRSDPGPRETAR